MSKTKKKLINGAEALIKCLEKQGVEYVFGYPGGAAIPIFDAIYDSKKLQLILHYFTDNQMLLKFVN